MSNAKLLRVPNEWTLVPTTTGIVVNLGIVPIQYCFKFASTSSPMDADSDVKVLNQDGRLRIPNNYLWVKVTNDYPLGKLGYN